MDVSSTLPSPGSSFASYNTNTCGMRNVFQGRATKVIGEICRYFSRRELFEQTLIDSIPDLNQQKKNRVLVNGFERCMEAVIRARNLHEALSAIDIAGKIVKYLDLPENSALQAKIKGTTKSTFQRKMVSVALQAIPTFTPIKRKRNQILIDTSLLPMMLPREQFRISRSYVIKQQMLWSMTLQMQWLLSEKGNKPKVYCYCNEYSPELYLFKHNINGFTAVVIVESWSLSNISINDDLQLCTAALKIASKKTNTPINIYIINKQNKTSTSLANLMAIHVIDSFLQRPEILMDWLENNSHSIFREENKCYDSDSDSDFDSDSDSDSGHSEKLPPEERCASRYFQLLSLPPEFECLQSTVTQRIFADGYGRSNSKPYSRSYTRRCSSWKTNKKKYLPLTILLMQTLHARISKRFSETSSAYLTGERECNFAHVLVNYCRSGIPSENITEFDNLQQGERENIILLALLLVAEDCNKIHSIEDIRHKEQVLQKLLAIAQTSERYTTSRSIEYFYEDEDEEDEAGASNTLISNTLISKTLWPTTRGIALTMAEYGARSWDLSAQSWQEIRDIPVGEHLAFYTYKGHYSNIFIKKVASNKLVFILLDPLSPNDSMSCTTCVLSDINRTLKKSPGGLEIECYVYKSKRQNDLESCSIFALNDTQVFVQEPDALFEWVRECYEVPLYGWNNKDPLGNWGSIFSSTRITIHAFDMLPPEYMELTQSISTLNRNQENCLKAMPQPDLKMRFERIDKAVSTNTIVVSDKPQNRSTDIRRLKLVYSMACRQLRKGDNYQRYPALLSLNELSERQVGKVSQSVGGKLGQGLKYLSERVFGRKS